MNDFLIHGNIPVTLFSNMITFRDSNKTFRLEGDLLKLITNYKFNADHSSPQDKKLIYEFAKEMNYDTKSTGRPSTRHTSIIKNLNHQLLWLLVYQGQYFYLLIIMNFVTG